MSMLRTGVEGEHVNVDVPNPSPVFRAGFIPDVPRGLALCLGWACLGQALWVRLGALLYVVII